MLFGWRNLVQNKIKRNPTNVIFCRPIKIVVGPGGCRNFNLQSISNSSISTIMPIHHKLSYMHDTKSSNSYRKDSWLHGWNVNDPRTLVSVLMDLKWIFCSFTGTKLWKLLVPGIVCPFSCLFFCTILVLVTSSSFISLTVIFGISCNVIFRTPDVNIHFLIITLFLKQGQIRNVTQTYYICNTL